MQQQSVVNRPAIYIAANALMNANISLQTAIEIASNAEADGFELRRELLPDLLSSDVQRTICQWLTVFPSPPVYSVHSPLFLDGQFDPEQVSLVLREARSLGCTLVKFASLGVDPGEPFVDLEHLHVLLQHEAEGLLVTVENDQSAQSADISSWLHFFELVEHVACPLKMTFDLGNWTCVGRRVLDAAQMLGQYVAYVHVKSIVYSGRTCLSAPIYPTTTQHPALAFFAPQVPRTLEFPLAASCVSELIEQLKKYIELLRSGNFAT